MKDITGLEPKMWGPSIVGFGAYHYKYASGHEGDVASSAFRRARNMSLLHAGPGGFATHLKKLGKYKTGKACLYIKKLADIDVAVLRR